MVAFLMLGIIPGTNIQITFADWAWGITLACGVMVLINAGRRIAQHAAQGRSRTNVTA